MGRERNKWKRTARIVGIRTGAVLVLLGAALWESHQGSTSSFWEAAVSVEAAGNLIRSWGNWGVAASVALMVISAATPFPAELVALANGVIYGPGWGAAITWGGGMLGALLTFGISRWFGRPLTRSLRHRRLRQWVGEWTEVESGTTLLLARLIPLIPFCLLNYAAGLTGMGWRTFVWATGLGILPFTVLMAVAGDWMGTLQWQMGFVVLGAVVALWLVLHRRSGGFSKGRLENGPGKIKYQGEN